MNEKADLRDGLGMSAFRIGQSLVSTAPQRLRSFTHVPFERVGPITLPEMYVPFELRLSPHLDAARESVVTWAHAMGILSEGVWDERALRDYDLPLCAAGLDPNGSADELDLESEWLVWGTYDDDFYPRVFSRDHAGGRVSNNRLEALMPVELSVPSVLPANALERGLADLWVRTAGPMALPQRRQFRHAVEKMLDSWAWELDNHHMTASRTRWTTSRCAGARSGRTSR